MDYESLLELAKKRRTIRKLKADPIPDEYVDKIIEVARWAPSGANSQPWEFIIVKDHELRNSIINLIQEYNKLSHKMELVREPELRFHWTAAGYGRAPVFIILCGDPRTKEAYPLAATLNQGESHLISSLASAFLYMQLAATTLGLGSQWVSVIAHPYVQSLTKDLLGVPQELKFYDMLAVGYPDIEPKPRWVRAKDDMVHHDHYDRARFKTEGKVKEYIVDLRQKYTG